MPPRIKRVKCAVVDWTNQEAGGGGHAARSGVSRSAPSGASGPNTPPHRTHPPSKSKTAQAHPATAEELTGGLPGQSGGTRHRQPGESMGLLALPNTLPTTLPIARPSGRPRRPRIVDNGQISSRQRSHRQRRETGAVGHPGAIGGHRRRSSGPAGRGINRAHVQRRVQVIIR